MRRLFLFVLLAVVYMLCYMPKRNLGFRPVLHAIMVTKSSNNQVRDLSEPKNPIDTSLIRNISD